MQDCRAGVFIDVTGLAAQRLDTDYVAGSSGNASPNAFCRTLRSNRLRHRIRVVATSPEAVQTKRLVTWMNSRAQEGTRLRIAPWSTGDG